MRTGRPRTPIAERFWPQVQKTATCWIWTGCRQGGKTGKYGLMWDPVNRNKAVHRLSWELHYGDIPEGLNVCHHCDNPVCVNPDHLFLGTSADNRRDCVKKKRHARGEKMGAAKLTEELVTRIRTDWKSMSGPKLAAKLGVSTQVVYAVRSNKTWAHVDNA